MAFQPSVDSFGIRRLGFKCSWWLQRQANDAVVSEGSIFSENHDYKSFFRVAVNTYVPIFRGLYARGGRKLRTDIHTHTHSDTHTRDNYSNPRYALARRGFNNCFIKNRCQLFLVTVSRIIIKHNALRVSKHVTESIRNIPRGVGIN